MSLQRGFGAIKEAKKKSDANRAAFAAGRGQDLFLKDGEEIEVWCNGDPGPGDKEEPVVVLMHTIRLQNPKNPTKPKIRNEVCAKGEDDHEGCVHCWSNLNGDKRVSKAQPTGYINVADGRWVHKIKNEEATAATGGKYERFDWFDCKDEGDEVDSEATSCKRCKRGVPRERAGQKKFRMSVTAASAFDGENESAHKRCLNCGGKIRRAGFTNGKKTVPDLDDVRHPENFSAIYECNKCDEPRPANIFCGPLTIRRNGDGMMTSYSFKLGPIEDMPDWVTEMEPYDFEKMLVPRSADKQAELLGIMNPFDNSGGGKKRGAKGATSYDDDDEEEADEKDDGFKDDEDDD